ncbi:hypothetical protein B0H11DRAFT_2393609 [Mycena galericulata]|nr:hypothetical protein B0H11DRAFT_2393609 [Mycena galericulata]
MVSMRRIQANPPSTWNQFLEVPPEIWGAVATLSSRQTIAHLCLVSPGFYSIFAPLLYGRTVSPPLTYDQSFLLVKTLSEVDRRALLGDSQPVLLVRSLAIHGRGGLEARHGAMSATMCHAALRNLSRIPGGSALRTLKWDMPEHMELLNGMLGYFPNLKEISFVRTPNLTKLGCRVEFGWADQGQGGALCKTLGEALRALPSSSPLLDTLELTLWILLTGSEPLWDPYRELLATINDLRFPCLISLNLSIDIFKTRILHNPTAVAVFSPFLHRHPLLADVTLTGGGIRTAADGAYLPQLRSLTSSVEHYAALLAQAGELERLYIVLNAPGSRENPTALSFPPDIGPTVRWLDIVIDEEHVEPYFPPSSFTCLAAAFPNLTHLNIQIAESMVRSDSY